jgi:hypothetical protein
MTDGEREKLKAQLRAMLAGQGQGIDIDTPFHWVIEGLKEATPFFDHLPTLLPSGSVLYLEGIGICPEMASYYAAHRAANAVEVVRDTISPVPDTYHVGFSPEVSAGLRRLSEKHPVAEMFDHIKSYKDVTMLFSFHDAFDGQMLVSENVPEAAIERFCRSLGGSRRREATKPRDLDPLRLFLRIVENPDEWVMQGDKVMRREKEPWLKRLRRKLK